RWNRVQEVQCPVVALDEALPPVPRLSFIKADIEGAELLAFRGAARLIDRHLPTVLCEINPWFLEGFGIRLEELTGFFFDRGYSLYRYDRHTRRLLRITDLGEVTEANYLFLHPARAKRFAQLFDRADEATPSTTGGQQPGPSDRKEVSHG